MAWWLWVLVGLALLGVEILTPGGFFILFFGVAALVTGGLVGSGAVAAAWVQWLLFSALSVISLLLFRERLLATFGSGDASGARAAPVVGETAVLTEDLAPGAVGRAELRGTSWSVRSRDPGMLERGRRCRVVEVDGLTLWVLPE
jgi:membrane protein implicated in regulation of membrane protease activity